MVELVLYSGGAGSHGAAARVIAVKGLANVILFFTDPLYEDADLYRFLIQASASFGGIDVSDLVERAKLMPPLRENEARKEFIKKLAADANARIPYLLWTYEGRTPWEVFKDKRFIGNTRLDPCSEMLKRLPAARFVEMYAVEDINVYLGIDWTEAHRYEKAKARWAPYNVYAPLCEEPFVSKQDILDGLEAQGIPAPRLYGLGFPHNNCSGFCVKAGQAHYRHLLQHLPDVFEVIEQEEQAVRDHLQKNVAILRDRRGNRTRPYPLTRFKNNLGGVDENDWGGCGCFEK